MTYNATPKKSPQLQREGNLWPYCASDVVRVKQPQTTDLRGWKKGSRRMKIWHEACRKTRYLASQVLNHCASHIMFQRK